MNIRPKREIQIGEVVLIGTNQTKRLDWPLALVVEIKRSRDKAKRLVTLRTSKGEIVRPVQNLYPLEIRQELNQEDIPEPEMSEDEEDDPDEDVEEKIKEDDGQLRTRTHLIKKPRKLDL